MVRQRLKIKGGAVIAAPFDYRSDYESDLFCSMSARINRFIYP